MINFPNRKQTVNKSFTNQLKNPKASLGMILEEMLNQTNLYYLQSNKAVIYKKPTPVQIVKVDYPCRERARITEAYFRIPSTTDYNGIYRGKYIDFEAKETEISTSFALRNIHPHQLQHLEDVIRHGGIGFILVHFKRKNETYYLPVSTYKRYWEAATGGQRKSIPYEVFLQEGKRINHSYQPQLDYLRIIDEIYFKENI